jgi:hypothetical protein
MEMDDKAAELHELAKRRYKAAIIADRAQRQRERDDLAFQVPEEQWTAEARAAREGSVAGGVPSPPRPCLSVSQIDQPIQLVLNQERAAKLGVSIQPIGPDANEEDARVREGIYRSIERDSNAHSHRSWAFARSSMAGRGWYRVNTVWDEESDSEFDQKIVIERILDGSAVLADPSATKQDFSDGEFLFVTSWMPIDTFKREYPDAQLSGDKRAFSDLVGDEPEWARGDGEAAAIQVAEYWYKEHESETIVQLEDGRVVPEEQAPKGAKLKNRRSRDKVTVFMVKVTGWETLEEPAEWNGKYIPLIPTIGKELQPYNGERRWTGIISNAKDSQRGFNYSISQSVESAALEPRAPFIGVEGQFEGHENEWQQANVRNFPFLEYKPVSLGGQPAPAPARVQVDTSRMNISLQLAEIFRQGVQTSTFTYDPALGRMSSREKSGRAIMALQEQSDAGNSNYMHNLADISMNYEARVILDLMPKIYDRPGRIARIIDGEEQTEMVMLNAPFVKDPQTGAPMQVQPGGMPPQGAKPKTYDLSKGKYSVAVSIGKARQTALQEGAEEIGQVLAAQPNLMPVIGPHYFRYRDFPGAKEIADDLTILRNKQFPELAKKEGAQPTPEQAQAQLTAAEQKLKEMAEQIQQMGQALETQQAKSAATVQKAQIDAEAKVAVAQIDQQTQIMLRELTAKVDMMLEASKQQHESKEAQSERVYDAVKTAATAVSPEWKGDNDTPLEVRSEI